MVRKTTSVNPTLWRDDVRDVRPMLATLVDPPPSLDGDRFVYEPKYDGIRAIVEINPPTVRIWSRLGNEKTAQFPELVRAWQQFARKLKRPVVLDGEIVALDDRGEPTGFQGLQGRIHLTGEREVGLRSASQPVAFIAFDVLRDGPDDLRPLPLVARRARLERIFGNSGSPLLRLSEFSPGAGQELYDQALRRGWEGLIAKDIHSRYESGRRSLAWQKVKIVRRQEFVIGGCTEPRGARTYFGALLLGVFEDRASRPGTHGPSLVYVGHTGTGFDEHELRRVYGLLKRLEIQSCPFAVPPRANERPHWVRPKLVAEIKFTEWTADGKLRHPVYLGLRDDVKPESVRREPQPPRAAAGSRRRAPTAVAQASRPAAKKAHTTRRSADLDRVIAQLQDLEDRGKDGTLDLPGGHQLEVTNLRKMFWPALKITKGELLRYYVEIAPLVLPAVDDRPLVMKRFPNGIQSKAFYQQRAPDRVPAGVRVEVVPGDTEVPSRLVGGSLTTLLYMTQLAAISQDPWFSRVKTPQFADHAALDLDPMPGVKFSQVVDAARWIHDELHTLGAPGFPKTSGASGLHVYVPLPPRTPYESGLIFCQIIATMVAARHPKVATVERAVAARGRRVYLDYLQNIQGKTLATAYSARASEFAGVSTPLTWKEVDQGVDPRDFTIRTAPERFQEVGDLWTGLRTSKPADLRAALKYVDQSGGGSITNGRKEEQ